MLKSLAKSSGESELVMERSCSTTGIGKHAWTMELYWDVPDGMEESFTNADARNGAGTIEWDIPSIDNTTHIGIWTSCGKLTDYDGIMGYLPAEAVALLGQVGITVDKSFTGEN